MTERDYIQGPLVNNVLYNMFARGENHPALDPCLKEACGVYLRECEGKTTMERVGILACVQREITARLRQASFLRTFRVPGDIELLLLHQEHSDQLELSPLSVRPGNMCTLLAMYGEDCTEAEERLDVVERPLRVYALYRYELSFAVCGYEVVERVFDEDRDNG